MVEMSTRRAVESDPMVACSEGAERLTACKVSNCSSVRSPQHASDERRRMTSRATSDTSAANRSPLLMLRLYHATNGSLSAAVIFFRPSAEGTVFFGEEVTMDKIDGEEVRGAVREHYGKVAALDGPGCAPGCCGSGAQSSVKLGYSEADLASMPAGADLGLGCGNPHVIAGLKAGETIVDL